MDREAFQTWTAGHIRLLDGATGSNLRAAGMPAGVCSETWVRAHPETLQTLQRAYVDAVSYTHLIEKLTWLGISGIANVLCCIKMAKYYELTEHDVVGTVLTDSAVMYGSRIEELNQMHGAYNRNEAVLDHNIHMLGLKTDNMMELNYVQRKRCLLYTSRCV